MPGEREREGETDKGKDGGGKRGAKEVKPHHRLLVIDIIRNKKLAYLLASQNVVISRTMCITALQRSKTQSK